ncbi:MAG: imidazole glycerol phosphate synthase subunit HisH [Phycisphaerales bacterium]
MTSGRTVTVVRTGTANVASVVAAFERIGVRTVLTDDPSFVESSNMVVLPGVGSFEAGMQQLSKTGLDLVIKERVAMARPTLGICLGMQLFAVASAESPGVAGLGVLPVRVSSLPESVAVPQLGWNRIEAGDRCRVLQSGAVYYANSYKIDAAPIGWRAAMTTHGGPFVGAIERGPVVLCQFHPELSGSFGARLLKRWCEVAEVVSC